MLLLVWIGHRVAQSERFFLTKLLIISGLFVFFALGGSRWKELWILLWPQWALVIGFVAGFSPILITRFSASKNNRNKFERQRQQAQADIENQKRVAEDHLRQRERETLDRLQKDKKRAQEQLRHEAERIKLETDEYIKKTRRNTWPSDPYKILGLKEGASKAEAKSAYRKLAAKYHPDKAVGATDEIKKLAEQHYIKIKSAYDEIRIQ